MAFATVNMVGPRSEQREPKEKKKDTMDYILEGLQLAQGITGIAVNYQTIKSKMGENAVAEDSKAGVLPMKEKAAHLENFDAVAPGTEGSVLMQYRKGDEVEKVNWLPRKKAEPGLKPPEGSWQETIGKDGKPVRTYVENKIGASVPSYVKPDKGPKDITVQERNTLQNQYDRDPEVRKTKTVLDSYSSAQKLLEQKTPASDQAIIYSYMKALDPGSVVRETEADTAAALGGLMERAKAQYAKMAGTGSLTDAQRQDLVNQIEALAASASERQGEIDNQFTELASRRGVDVKDLRLINKIIKQKPGQVTQNSGEAFAAPADAVPTYDINAIDAELKRRMQQSGGR